MSVLTIDITNNFDQALASIFNLFAYVFNQMNNIKFHNTSILMVFLGLGILGVALPVVLTLSKGITQTSERIRPKRSEKKNDNE